MGAASFYNHITEAPSGACKTPDHSEVYIRGGTFWMGSAEYYEEEGPVHQETVASFWVDRYDVTNADFAKLLPKLGPQANAGDVVYILVADCHEHMGQLVAYARENAVVPPWTIAAKKAAAEKAAKDKAEADKKPQ